MISSKIYLKSLLAIMALVAVISCSDPWDDRIDKVDPNLTQNLAERIESTPQTSAFGKLLDSDVSAKEAAIIVFGNV